MERRHVTRGAGALLWGLGLPQRDAPQVAGKAPWLAGNARVMIYDETNPTPARSETRMKTKRFLVPLPVAIFSVAVSSALAGAEQKKIAAGVPSPSELAIATVSTTAPQPVAEARPDSATAPAEWSDISENTYDTRAQFFAGLKRLEARVDVQVRELNEQRAAMKSTRDTKDWDFAMKEMDDARTYLISTGEELGKATPETWVQLKDKVGQAWMRTQAAYDKVKASVTS